MARLALQVGHTPNTYYLAEPSSRADLATSVVGESDATTWRYIQQALLGYKIPLGRGLGVRLQVTRKGEGLGASAELQLSDEIGRAHV